MKFGLMFFASSEDALRGDKYQLIINSARFGDQHGFSSIWVPERHFTKFGSLYPNPAVLQSALAMVTKQIHLRAGSVVVPLHHPLRIAEEWAMVDNLSHGRVGVSFAPGWHPQDFAFFPQHYHNRKQEMYKNISIIQRLWRGEKVEIENGIGEKSDVRIYPTPLQPELPLWITAAGSPDTYALAGRLGAHLLTHILDQEIVQLKEKIAIYRRARTDAGLDPLTGEVSLMLHTFVGENEQLVREQARKPFCQYIKSNFGLLKGLAQSRGRDVEIEQMSERVLDEFVDFLYDRFAATRGLIGTPTSCLNLLTELETIGVDEIACLLDFGPPNEQILNYLPYLHQLKNIYTTRSSNGNNVNKAFTPFLPQMVQARCKEELSGQDFHAFLKIEGIEIDPQLYFIEHVWQGNGEALAKLKPLPSGFYNTDYHIHPAYLDACGRVLAAALPQKLLKNSSKNLYLPAGLKSFRLHNLPQGYLWSHAILKSIPTIASRETLYGDVNVYDAGGKLVLQIEDLLLKTIEPERVTTLNSAYSHSDWFYSREWQPITLTDLSLAEQQQTCLILADQQGVGKELARELQAQGHSVIFVTPNSIAEQGYIEDLIYGIVENKVPLHSIVHLSSLDTTASDQLTKEKLLNDQTQSIKSALILMQALAKYLTKMTVRTYFVTQAAIPTSYTRDILNITQTPLWGLAKVFALEHTNFWGGLIDLDTTASTVSSAQILSQIVLQLSEEDMLAIRKEQCYVPRLKRQILPAVRKRLNLSDQATFLITGGMGGLGQKLAHWLAENGARYICLLSRNATPFAPLLEDLAKLGVKTMVMAVDVANEEDMVKAIAQIKAEMPPLRGVFHLAGILDDALLTNEHWQRLTQISAAKVEGAWQLHHLTKDLTLDFFVMFSSMASLLMLPGQGNYAMANSFLDALAHYRHSLHLPALSINWGPWAEYGHASTNYGREAHAKLTALGIQALPLTAALAALTSLMECEVTQSAVVSIDWYKLFQQDPLLARLPMVREFVLQYQSREKLHTGHSAIIETLHTLPASERRKFLQDFLAQNIGQTLKMAANFVIEPRQKLFELGLDSIMAIELKNHLEHSFAHTFSATLLFMHPTLEALTDYLLKEVVGELDSRKEDRLLVDEKVYGQDNIDNFSEEQMVDLLLSEINASEG